MLDALDPSSMRGMLACERDCYVDWIDALRSVPGNPWRATVRVFGDATAVVCPGSPARIVNRCFGLSSGSIKFLPDILGFFAEHGAEPSIDVDPFGDYGDDFFAALAGNGLIQSGFHQTLFGRLDAGNLDKCATESTSWEIEAAGLKAEAAYATIHERVFGPRLLISVLLFHSNFHCFLATVGGRPAALGVLHVRNKVASMANGITLPEYRGHGLQSALLHQRLRMARDLGCSMVIGQAQPSSVSTRNQLRAGLSLAGTKAIWSKPPDPAHPQTLQR